MEFFILVLKKESHFRVFCSPWCVYFALPRTAPLYFGHLASSLRLWWFVVFTSTSTKIVLIKHLTKTLGDSIFSSAVHSNGRIVTIFSFVIATSQLIHPHPPPPQPLPYYVAFSSRGDKLISIWWRKMAGSSTLKSIVVLFRSRIAMSDTELGLSQ